MNTVTPRQLLAAALRVARTKTPARHNDALDVLENCLAESTSDLEFYATLRNYASAVLAILRVRE